MNENLDARAWAIWVLATAVLTMIVRNPFYILIIFLAARLVAAEWGRAANQLPVPFWRIGLIMLTFSALFNGLFAPLGGTTLFSLPDWPLIGGPVSVEALLFGLINGFVLWTLLAVFLALNAIVPAHQLVRLTPRAFHDLGVVMLIALTYLPETTRHLQRIREAQAVRGHQLRSWRDWPPILLPLLIGGLERAMQLAETMVARGYGAARDVRTRGRVQLLLTAALLLAFGGWLALLWQRPLLGGVLVAAAAILMGALLWQMGRRTQTTRYRPTQWRWRDSLLVVTAVIPLLLVWLPWPGLDRASLYYSPYPAVAWPVFSPLLGMGLALLALPAFAVTTKTRRVSPADS